MAERPVPSPTSTISNPPINDLVYDEPGNENMMSSTNHTEQYEIPEIKHTDRTSASTSQPIHYQQLHLNNAVSSDYQSLQDNRTAVVNPTFIQLEEPNAYEPLRGKKLESEYQQLDRC